MFTQCHPEPRNKSGINSENEVDIRYLATCCLSRVRFEGAGSSNWILRLKWLGMTRCRTFARSALAALFALCILWPAQTFAASDLRKQMMHDMKKCGSTTEEVTCVVEGKDGWLFLQESLLDAVTPWHDNTPQIIAFKDSLEARGIKLIVIPVPDKLLVVPEQYSDKAKKGINLPQYKKWVDKLRKKNVTVIDALDKIKELHKNLGNETPMFEPYESHCTGPARLVLAKMATDSIAPLLYGMNRKRYPLHDTIVDGTGNLYDLLHGEEIEYKIKEQKVLGTDGYKYRGSKKAPIIVIGDSNAGQGKSYGAHIGAYIAMATSVETFTISKVGGGNIGPQMFKGKTKFLEDKKAVVWVFDGRELYGHFKAPEF